ncbi:acyltransferase family protein [Aeromicrobium sp.]|uniref:acyltransferase family protein n=1 Tax=Aeromicrobium sp. TaxID=1871063 RepID=UPI003D6C5286
MVTAILDERAPVDRPPAKPLHSLRTDIQALRAIAVTSVVVFHLWPDLLPGGFVGVDVFFVISGYLITAHLFREVEKTGRLRLGRFWAARARRLLPAALLTLVLTAVGVMLLLPRSLWDQFLYEVMASASYVQNWLLASNAVDYLAADNLPSPAQHFWSLSVEEQFYVALPLLMCLALVAAKVGRVGRLQLIWIVLIAVTIASFAYSVYLTASSPDVAYFSTFTRMWEFGLGGLASFAVPAIANLPRRRVAAHTLLTIAGAVAIIASFFVIDSGTPFPGSVAALPVLGTVAVVRWGGSTFATTVGALQPAAVLGRISYALYLWHWPLIILLPFVTVRPLSNTDKYLIFALAVTISWVSTRLVEEPIRFSFAQRVRPRTMLIAVAVAMVPVLAVPALGRAAVDQDQAGHAAELARVLEENPRCLGAASMDPDRECVNPALDGVVVPHPADAINDRTDRQGCWSGNEETVLSACTVGPVSGYDLRIAAVGDSHTKQLIPAFEVMAEKYNWRIDVAGHAGCNWTAAEPSRKTKSLTANCKAWQENLAAYLDRPGAFDAVITSKATSVAVDSPAGVPYEQTAVQGLVDAWTTQTPSDVPVIALVDNPQTALTNVQCVEQFGKTDPDRCASSRAWALSKFDGHPEAVERVDKASLVDMTRFYCDETTCPSVIGGVMVYKNNTHLTRTYVRTLAPYLGREIAAALRKQGVR